MRRLSVQTRFYIIGTLLAGTILFFVYALRWNWQETWIQTIVLSLLGALTLLFKVEGSTDRTHYDITFIIYGCSLILFGAPNAVIVILVAHIVEWIWHKYKWYIQAFNIASYVIVAVTTNMVYELANPARSLETWQGAISVLAAMAIFTFLNHLMIGIIVWMARGENFVQSGIFRFFPIMLDWTLLCMGSGIAVVWNYNPFAVIPFLLPLYLIYSTLRVPALERQVETDTKTGLFNHKYFLNSLETELRRASRFGRPMTVVMADIDLLRNINSLYGHLAGDVILIGIARILKTYSRDYDIVARFGGEEFALLMPETTPEEAYSKVNFLRMTIEKEEFVVQTSVTPIKASMSFGIAGREEGLDGNSIIHNADMALYQAKLNGRNRVYIGSNKGFKDVPQSLLETDPAPTYQVTQQAESHVPVDKPEVDKPFQPVDEHKTSTARQPETEKPGENPRKHTKTWVDLYILDLALVAAGLFSLTILNFPSVDWSGVLIFGILVAATEWASIEIYFRNTSVSTSAAPLIAGILLFGPAGAIIMSITLAAVTFIKHKGPFNRFVFNTANQLFAAIICILLIRSTGSSYTNWSTLIQLLVSLLAGMLIYCITSVLIAIGISINSEEPVRQIWIEQFSWLAPSYLGMGVIAYALIFSYIHSGVLGTLVILIPLIILRLSQKQFIDHTKDTVIELRKKNEILQNQSREISLLNNDMLETLAEVIDLRDPYIFGHSQQVTHYAVLIAEQMGMSIAQIEIVRKSSLIHDVGNMGVDSNLLAKSSGLSEIEFDNVKRHVIIGADLLRKSHSLQPLVPIVLHHHERFDGKGYPDHLKGSEIPLQARVICLADAVEAMASGRPYQPSMNFEEILEEIRRCSGSQFDPAVVRAFEKLAEKKGPSLIGSNTHSIEVAS